MPVYLALGSFSTPFQMAGMFAGYLPTTHQGLLAAVNEAMPFEGTASLVWLADNDPIASDNLAEKFSNPVIVRDPNAGHVVPGSTAATFAQVVEVITTGACSSGCGGGGEDGSKDGESAGQMLNTIIRQHVKQVFDDAGSMLETCNGADEETKECAICQTKRRGMRYIGSNTP